MKKSITVPLTIAAGVILVIAVLGAIFISPAGNALASTLFRSELGGSVPWKGMWHNGGPGGGSGFSLPPALQGLASIPAGQRFDHFTGIQVMLMDQNNNPLTINVIPGKVTAASATSLTIEANKGGSQSFTLDQHTIIHSLGAYAPTATGTPSPERSASQVDGTALQNGDDVVVVTLNNSSTATTVIASGPGGFNWSGRGVW